MFLTWNPEFPRRPTNIACITLTTFHFINQSYTHPKKKFLTINKYKHCVIN